MIRNYFKTALRNLGKHKFYALINIFGLSVGVAVCIIIALFVVNELSYDRHHEHAHRIYRIKSEIIFGGNHMNMLFTPAPLAAALQEEFPEVAAAVHFRQHGSYLVKRETENMKEQNVVWAGKEFFNIFTAPLLEGNPEGILDAPNTMAVSERTAKKFFPGENALGQTLILDNQSNFKITGVYENMPANSHFDFDFILAAEGLPEAKETFWLSNNFQTYLLLHEGADAGALNAKLPQMVATHIEPQLIQVIDVTLDKFNESGNKIEYSLQPLSDVHLKSNLTGEFKPGFSMTYVYMFVAIALFILLIACINFMNLSTARSANRAKEVGVRKVMGSGRLHLIRQFLAESTLLSVLAFLIAIGIAWLLLPLFNGLAGRNLSIPFSSVSFYGILMIGAVLTGLLAGIYPAFFLSAFKPVSVLKGQVSLGMRSGFVRSSLVVFQFTVSIILIIATIAVFSQLNYIQNKKIGFNKDQVIMVEDAYTLGDQRLAYKNEILNHGMIVSGTFSGYLPVSDTWRSDNPWWVEGRDPSQQENMVSLQNWSVDHDYITTLGMTMKEGRDFSLDFPSDSSAVILNETAVRSFNFDGDPIGKRIATFGGENREFDRDNLEILTVIGIVDNFHFESLKADIGPVMLFLSSRPQGFISFRFQSADTKAVVGLLESKWREMAPGQPFTYSFLDDSFGRMYAAETRLGKVFAVFAGFAIVIACLGLFALAAFMAEQRTKEIGIRKVLGATVSGIVGLLSKDFVKLLLIAIAIASPLAWWAMNRWLEDFAYRIEIQWWMFAMAGLSAVAIALLTVSYQAIRAAIANPVDSLRDE